MLQSHGLRAGAGGGVYEAPERGEYIPSAGGYFGGHMRSEDGRSVYQIIIADKSTEVVRDTNFISITDLEYNNLQTNDQDYGFNNTNPTVSGSLNHNGFSDWYIPSVKELQQIYRFLKPGFGVQNEQGTDSSGFAVNIDWYRNQAAAPSWYPGNASTLNPEGIGYNGFFDPLANNPFKGGRSQAFEFVDEAGTLSLEEDDFDYYVYESSTIVDQVTTPINANKKARVHFNFHDGEIIPYEYVTYNFADFWGYVSAFSPQASTKVVTRYIRRVPLNVSPTKVDEFYEGSLFETNDYQDGKNASHVSYKAEFFLVGAGGPGKYGGGGGGQALMSRTRKLSTSELMNVRVGTSGLFGGGATTVSGDQWDDVEELGFPYYGVPFTTFTAEGGGSGARSGNGVPPVAGGGGADTGSGFYREGGTRDIGGDGGDGYNGIGGSGGGGGAAGNGRNASQQNGGDGGVGVLNNWETGVNQYYGHGGGGYGDRRGGSGGTAGASDSETTPIIASRGGNRLYNSSGEPGRDGYGNGAGGDPSGPRGGSGVILIRVPAAAGDSANAGVSLTLGYGGNDPPTMTTTEWGPYRVHKITVAGDRAWVKFS